MKQIKSVLKAKLANAKVWIEVNRRSIAALIVGFILGKLI